MVTIACVCISRSAPHSNPMFRIKNIFPQVGSLILDNFNKYQIKNSSFSLLNLLQIILCLTLVIGMVLIQQLVHQAPFELLNCIGHQLSQCFNLWVGAKIQIYLTSHPPHNTFIFSINQKLN